MSREVELIVRLKDEVSRFADSVVDSLKEITGVQDDLAKGAGKTSTLLGQLGKEFKELNDEARRLTSLGKITESLDKSAAAIARLETNVKSSAQELANLARESAKAQAVADRMRGSLDAEQRALQQSKDARKASTRELTAATRAVTDAERIQKRFNDTLAKTKTSKGVGIEAGQSQTSARASAGVFIAAEVESTRARQAALAKEVKVYQQEVDRSTQAIAELKPQLQAASRQQGALAEQTSKASNELAKSRDGLTRARTAYTDLSGAADKASGAMGRTSLTQEAVAKSSARAAAEIARTKAQIELLSTATAKKGAPADISRGTEDADARRAAIERLRTLRGEMAKAQVEAQNLNRALATTDEPTEALGRAAGVAQARVRDLKQEISDITTRLRASQGGFLQWSQSVSQMRGATAGAAAGANELANAGARAAGGLRPLGQAAQGVGQGMRSASGGANILRSAFAGVYGDSRKSLSLMQRLRGEVLSLAAAYLGLHAAINSLSGVIKAFQTIEAAQNRLGAVFNQDTSRVTQELAWLERQASRLGISFGQLSDQYAKFAIAADAANFSSEATRKIFLSVAEAGRVNKLSTEQLEGVFLALEQMISKGKISSEELRRQLGDRLPGAFNIFANALGLSTSQLDEMMRKGEVLSTESNLLKFAAELDKRFGSQLAAALRSTTAELGRFDNSVLQAQLLFARGGFIEAFTDGLRNLNEYFASREGRDFFLSLGAAAGKFVSALALLPPYLDEIATGLQVFAAVKIAGVLTNLIASLRQAAVSANSFGRELAFIGPRTQQFVQNQTALNRALVLGINRIDAWRGSLSRASVGLRALGLGLGGLRATIVATTTLFRGLWAAAGGLPGIILTGVTIALGQWATQIDTATSALDEHMRQMQLIKAAYDEAKGKVKDWAKEVNNLTVTQLEKNLLDLVANFDQGFAKLSETATELRRSIRNVDEAGGKLSDTSIEILGGPERAQKEFALMRDILNELDEAAQTRNLDKLRTRLDQIAQATQVSDIKTYAATLIDMIDKMGEDGSSSMADLAKAILEAEAKLRLYNGTATEADKILLGLQESSDKAAGSTEKLGDKAKSTIDIFNEMGKSITSIGDELKRLESINGLNKQYNDAVKLARTMSEVMGLTSQYNKAADSIIGDSITGSNDLVDIIGGIESGGNPNAKNPMSTATGLGQFIESTWLRMFKQYFPDRAAGLTDAMILERRKDAADSRAMIALYIKENAAILNKAGVAVTNANLYLAHFLGPGGATKLLKAPPGQPVADILAPGQISANQSILGGGRTAADVVAWAQRKVGISKEELTIVKSMAEEEVKRTNSAKEYNTDLENRLSLQENENSNAGRLTQEAFVQKRLAEEEKRAKEANVTLDAAQIERIKAAAAAEYLVTQAKREGTATVKEANVALQQAVALNQQRNTLQQQFNAASRSGDVTAASALQVQLDGVNTQLEEAIAKARAMWEAIGGPQADVALTKLDTLSIKTAEAGNRMTFLGLSTDQVGQLAGSFADGLVGVFDAFAQAIANGEDAVEALGKAFLQFAANFLREIATMILKQLILNALQSFMGGIGVPIGHTGGMVGASSVGVGNNGRNVSAALFAGAMRYHGGGRVRAGLSAGEVPIIAKEGEEILTEDNPRHRNNVGRDQGRSSAPQAIRIVNVLDDQTAEQMMNSATGERVFMAHAKKNRATLKSMLGS